MSTLAANPTAAPAAAATIMIVEDTPFWQKQVAQAIQAAGYATALAGDGVEALALVESARPDLIVCDIDMPRMTGLEFMKALRAKPQGQAVPVILLTTGAAKELVIEATRLRAAEYMLKGAFSADQLVERIRKWLNKPKAAAPSAAPPSAAAAAPKRAAAATAPASAFPRLLQRGDVIAGVTAAAAAGKTFPAVVAQLAELAKAPPANPPKLPDAVKHDPIVAMRLLQFANAAKRVGTIEDAARAVGPDGIARVARAVAAFNQPAPSSALPLWQHSVAVATVMHRIVPRSFEMSTGVAYVIGLLHDLPEILLRQAFPAEYTALVDFAGQAGKPARHILPDVFGVSLADVAAELVTVLKLPPLLAGPLREHAAATEVLGAGGGAAGNTADPIVDRLALALRFAEYVANGLHLTANPADAFIAPLTLADCRTAYVATDPVDGADVRATVVDVCNKLSGATPAEPAAKPRPKLCYVRHHGYAALDPLEQALRTHADVDLRPDPPAKREDFARYGGVVVCAPSVDTFGLLWCLPDRLSADPAARPTVLHVVPPFPPDAKRPPLDPADLLHPPFSLSKLQTALGRFR